LSKVNIFVTTNRFSHFISYLSQVKSLESTH